MALSGLYNGPPTTAFGHLTSHWFVFTTPHLQAQELRQFSVKNASRSKLLFGDYEVSVGAEVCMNSHVMTHA